MKNCRCIAALPVALRAALLCVLPCALLGGCGLTPPRPWEKELLADPAMQPERDALGRRLQSQVLQSREAASGGDALRGSGCGCN